MNNGELFFIFRNLTIFFAGLMLVKYFIFLMVAPFHGVKEEMRKMRLKKIDARRQGIPYEPKISVIVPAWNEEVGILKTVRSVLANSYPNIDLNVINDGSTDSTDAVMREFLKSAEFQKISDRYPRKTVKYFKKRNGGKGKALNYGINHSNGEIVITIDADSAIAPDALANMVRYFEDPKIDAAVGQVRIDKNPSIFGLIQKLEYAFGFYHKRAHSVMGAEYIFGGACAAFRRKTTFDEFGLYDTENKTEDIEMSMRCRYFGKNSVYAENVLCYTEGPSDLVGLINQRLRWKKGRIDTFIKYRNLFFSRKDHHNRYLAWMVLPYSLLSEFHLSFEPIGFTLLITYSILTGDYLSLAIGVLFIFVMYMVVGLFSHDGVNLRIMLLFPLTWPLFYLLVWVEYIVLLRSVVMLLRGEEIEWQKWNRKGVQI